MALEVRVQRVAQLGHRGLFVIEDDCLDSHDRVDGVGGALSQRPERSELRPSGRHIRSRFDRPLDECTKQGNGGEDGAIVECPGMILYGSGDPIEALKLVGSYVIGCHCKDGTPPTEPDALGTETPLGQGDVGIERFIRTLVELGYEGPLTIEREITGDQQKADIIEARSLLERIRDEILGG